MVKPFSNVELMLRVRALLRRAARYTAPAGESTGRKDAADESEALAAADRRSTDFGSPAAEGPKVSLENGNMEEVSLGAEFQSEHMLPYKDLVLDLDSQSVWKGEEMISLTRTEFQILELFFSHPKKIYSMENIYQSIWQEEAVGDSTIMVHIKNLRKKLGDSSRNPQYIKTAWGKGYYAE